MSGSPPSTAPPSDRVLVVILHGYVHAPADMAEVRAVVRDVWPNADILVPRLATRRFSTADANDLVARVVRTIDQRWQKGPAYSRIVLVGHSLGALIARKVYLVACGEHELAPFEDSLRKAFAPKPLERLAWAGAIDRIVLLAAMNRGWRVSHHLSLVRAPVWALGSFLGYLIRLIVGRWPLIMTIRRGAEFVTNLRIQWIIRRNAQRVDGVTGPLTIQLLGSRDDLVSPDDNIDLVSGSHFVYLDVPQSDHSSIIKMAGPGAPEGRREMFRRTLTRSLQQLKTEAVIPSDDPLSDPQLDVTDVVFVMHGIRDEGYWTHKIARKVRALGTATDRVWATETSSYGYFAMLPFLLPLRRRQKVEWMMDQYAEALARYPNARFHYVGHSNGTYLLAKALELYRACRFSRVVFAGSVVRRRYDWSRAMSRGQVQAVLNWVATRDWVVAFFPRIFEVIPLQDLGSAGHDGFSPRSQPGLTQLGFVRGGHSAAIEEKFWDSIAWFITAGNAEKLPADALSAPQSKWVVVLGQWPPLVWAVIAALLIALGVGIDAAMTALGGPWAAGFACAAFVSLVLFALRRI